MRIDEELFALTVIMVCFFTLCGYLVYVARTDTYPTSAEDCPAGHVYIDYGETPQAGCWPEGVARQMGVYPEPEEP